MAKADIKQALKYSDYWTWFTEWLLGFGGKAAWPVLIICTLYMGAELYPGVNLPGPLNFAVFLAQLFALDMGGMGLVSIARQVKDAGHEAEAKQADGFGKVLVAIVITSLVTVGVKQFLSGIPALTANHSKNGDDSIMATYIEPIIMAVEFVLVIARVVCAVLYGKVMHSLKHAGYTSTTPTRAPEVDSWTLVGLAAFLQQEMQQSLANIQTTMDQRFQAIIDEQARMLALIQHVQDTSSVDYQALIQAVADDMIPQFQARFQAVDQALFRQNVAISEVQNQAKLLPELRQKIETIQAKKLPEKADSIQATQAKIRQPVQAKNRPTQADKNVIRLVPANASRDELIAEAKRLRDVEGLSTYAIGEKLGKSAKTVQSWLSSGKDQAEFQAESEVIEAVN